MFGICNNSASSDAAPWTGRGAKGGQCPTTAARRSSMDRERRKGWPMPYPQQQGGQAQNRAWPMPLTPAICNFYDLGNVRFKELKESSILDNY